MVEEPHKKKEVVSLDQFAICPKCGHLMALLHSKYTMYGMTPSGKYPNKVFGIDEDYTMACVCGYRTPMVKTLLGLYPKNHYKLQEEEEIMNQKPYDKFLLGYIEK